MQDLQQSEVMVQITQDEQDREASLYQIETELIVKKKSDLEIVREGAELLDRLDRKYGDDLFMRIIAKEEKKKRIIKRRW
jgi:hypothetical protein